MKKTVLIADDEVNILNLIKLNLGDEYNYIEAMDGLEVLQKLEHETPDIILLDIMMPKMDGFTVCKRIKQNPKTKDIPIVFISAKSEEQDVLYGIDIGASAYVTKPFNKQDISEIIKSIIG